MTDRGGSSDAIRRAALTLLQQRPYTVERLTRLLLRRGLDPDGVQGVVRQLQGQGLLDDEAFARDYVELHGGQRGARRLATELRSRGVASDVIARALEGMDRSNEQEAAVALLRQVRGRYRGLDRPVAQRRAVGFLARRGYPSSVVHEAVRQVLGELERDDG